MFTLVRCVVASLFLVVAVFAARELLVITTNKGLLQLPILLAVVSVCVVSVYISLKIFTLTVIRLFRNRS